MSLDKYAIIRRTLELRKTEIQAENLREVIIQEAISLVEQIPAYNQSWFLLNPADVPADTVIEGDNNAFVKEAGSLADMIEEFSGNIRITLPPATPVNTIVRLLFYQVVF